MFDRRSFLGGLVALCCGRFRKPRPSAELLALAKRVSEGRVRVAPEIVSFHVCESPMVGEDFNLHAKHSDGSVSFRFGLTGAQVRELAESLLFTMRRLEIYQFSKRWSSVTRCYAAPNSVLPPFKPTYLCDHYYCVDCLDYIIDANAIRHTIVKK